MYQYPNYLAHHGVKGMKWGVRRKQRKAAKLQKRRDAYLAKTSEYAKTHRIKANTAKSQLADLKNLGLSHPDVVKLAMADAEFFNADYSTNADKFKSEAYSVLTTDASDSYKYYSTRAKKWESANKQVMDLPLNSSNRAYKKAISKGKKLVD